MEPSPVERSANHFGVQLRKVFVDGSESNECVNTSGRRSMPPGTNCENRATQRRSVNISGSQVALRQELAEKHAIDRHKKSNSLSLEKRLKPSLPPKPTLKASSSLGNIPKSASSVEFRKPTGPTQRRSPLVRGDRGFKSKTNTNRTSINDQAPTSEINKMPESSVSSWLSPLYSSYEEYRPGFEALYVRIAEAVNRQVKLVHKAYANYQREFNREARKWRNVRLGQRAMHGHSFLAVGVQQPTWCDKCTGLIWGRCTVCLQCVNCKFKCHQHCEDSLSTQCTGPITDKSQRGADSWADHKHLRHDAADDADSGYSGSGGSAGFTLTKEEICSKINAYNENVGRSSGAMTFPSDGSDSFQGCIKVCVCIDRPISMSLSSRPTSIFEALHREEEVSPQTSPKNTVAAEHLPHNAQVSLHTNSLHTASEVVGILLNKFKITDNPKSFALFEQTIQYEKEVKLRKIGDQERPLLNYLRWSTESEDSKRFVLKENDSGDIMYEAFSIPELNNFLRVLEEEEAVKLTDIQNKFQVRRKQLADRLREIDMERSSIKPSSLRTGR